MRGPINPDNQAASTISFLGVLNLIVRIHNTMKSPPPRLEGIAIGILIAALVLTYITLRVTEFK